MSSSPIQGGRSVRTPQRTPSQEDTTYSVKSGDTLSRIALQQGVDLRALLAANPQIKNPDFILPNQVINIPAGQPAPAASAPSAPVTAGKASGSGTFETAAHPPAVQTQFSPDVAGAADIPMNPVAHSQATALRQQAQLGPKARVLTNQDGRTNDLNGSLPENGGAGVVAQRGNTGTGSGMVGQQTGTAVNRNATFTRAGGVTTSQTSRTDQNLDNNTRFNATQTNTRDNNRGVTTQETQRTFTNGKGDEHSNFSRTRQLDSGNRVESFGGRSVETRQTGDGSKFRVTDGESQTTATNKDGSRTVTRLSTERDAQRLTGLDSKTTQRMAQIDQQLEGMRGSSGAFKPENDAEAKEIRALRAERYQLQTGIQQDPTAVRQRTAQIDEKLERFRGSSGGFKPENAAEAREIKQLQQERAQLQKAVKDRNPNDDAGDHNSHAHRAPSVDANLNLAAVQARSGWRGAVTAGNDPTFMRDQTGTAGEAHVLAARGQAGAAAGMNLKSGGLHAGAQAGVDVDLVGVSGRSQLGSSNTVSGQAYVRGQAGVGGNASVGGSVQVDPRNATARLGVGGEAFAGAEVRAAVGYQNRYLGAEVDARGQAGAGVAARAEVGMERGVFRARADLGACVGLGGRVSVNINVNAAAIYQDSKAAATQVITSGWNSVRNWF